ncbi:hypothetical protein BsWGS_06191 [Bradybaena similaris]
MEKIKAEAAEADKKRSHDVKKFDHEKDVQTRKEAVEQERERNKQEFERQKREWKEDVPRHKKYQGLIKSFTKEDEIGSWIRNLESILRDERIPEYDWAFVLRKCLTGEPLKVLETVPDDQLNNYKFLKKLIEQHFQLSEMGLREKFKLVMPKSNQTFLDFVSEVQLTLENWLRAGNVGDI